VRRRVNPATVIDSRGQRGVNPTTVIDSRGRRRVNPATVIDSSLKKENIIINVLKIKRVWEKN
jgi:hypothetical protein